METRFGAAPEGDAQDSAEEIARQGGVEGSDSDLECRDLGSAVKIAGQDSMKGIEEQLLGALGPLFVGRINGDADHRKAFDKVVSMLGDIVDLAGQSRRQDMVDEVVQQAVQLVAGWETRAYQEWLAEGI